MGWSESTFDYCTPRYFFNAYRGHLRANMEQARLIAYMASLIHASGSLRIQDFGLFPWENPLDYAPKFAPVDPERLEYFKTAKFKPLPNNPN